MLHVLHALSLTALGRLMLASVTGSRNRLTLRGECPNVMVSGDRNTVSVEIATRITVTGNDNQ